MPKKLNEINELQKSLQYPAIGVHCVHGSSERETSRRDHAEKSYVSRVGQLDVIFNNVGKWIKCIMHTCARDIKEYYHGNKVSEQSLG